MVKVLRIKKAWFLPTTMAVALAFGLVSSTPAEALLGSFGSKKEGSYYRVEWRKVTNCMPWKLMAGDKLFDLPGRCDKPAINLGKVRVVDYTTKHFPTAEAVATINQYLAANSNMFRLEYVNRWTSQQDCSNHEPCVEVHETNGPLGALGVAEAHGSVCSLSTHNYVTMSWPNSYKYSPAVRKGATMHEIYHAIGLDHSHNPIDIMYSAAGEPTAPSTGISRATPSSADSQAINILYGRWGSSAAFTCK